MEKIKIYLVACRQLGDTLDRTLSAMPNIEHFYYDYTQQSYDFSKEADNYDFILVLKGINGVNPEYLVNAKTLKVLWFNDNIEKYTTEFKEFSKYFDKIFTMNKDNDKGIGFVGFGVDVTQFYDLNIERDIDVSFVGHINPPERAIWLKKLREYVNVRHFQGIDYKEYLQVLNRSKITINSHWNRYGANMRFFEALGTKSLMITDKVKGVPTGLHEGLDYLTYQNIPYLIDKIQYYLKNETERKKIVNRAYEVVREHYKYSDRINELIKKCKLEGFKK